jgi:hypothetical protein
MLFACFSSERLCLSGLRNTLKEHKQPEKTVLFPIKLDTAVMKTDLPWAANMRRMRHIGDFTKWKNHDDYQKAFNRLLRDLKASEKNLLPIDD